MRFVHIAAIALLFAPIAANAQTAAPGAAPAAPTTQAPAVTSTPKPKTTRAERFQARFETANTAHDGRLTLDQARANNWKTVINSFSKVDTDGKGYVTADQLQSYYQSQRAAKAKAKQDATPSNGTTAVPSRS